MCTLGGGGEGRGAHGGAQGGGLEVGKVAQMGLRLFPKPPHMLGS